MGMDNELRLIACMLAPAPSLTGGSNDGRKMSWIGFDGKRNKKLGVFHISPLNIYIFLCEYGENYFGRNECSEFFVCQYICAPAHLKALLQPAWFALGSGLVGIVIFIIIQKKSVGIRKNNKVKEDFSEVKMQLNVFNARYIT